MSFFVGLDLKKKDIFAKIILYRGVGTMKEKRLFISNTLNVIWIILLYHIIGTKSLFLYILSLSLYNIFEVCFNHITLKDTFNRLHSENAKKTILKIMLLLVTLISGLFLVLSTLISDTISLFLKLDNILPIFTIMGITVIIKPLIKLLSEYLENINNNRIYGKLPLIYTFFDKIMVLLIALLNFRILKTNPVASAAILYLSKIISAIIIIYFLYLIRKHGKDIKYNYAAKDNISYFQEIKKIMTNNSYKTITEIVKYSYYYISIIILYLVLSSRYGYKKEELEIIISFVYFFGLGIMNYLIYFAKAATRKLPKDTSVTDKLYNSFKMMLTITIIFGIISPLTCKVIFYDPSKSIYLTMVNFMAIFILLFDMTYENIKNKSITYISLIAGLIIKIVLVIPLINSFYRMGYNLVYGDVLSTSIAMFISVIINYIYLRQLNKEKDKYFTKILDILYDNIILAIILIVFEFIIPLNTKNYFVSLGLIIVYIMISIAYIVVKNKIKNKERG